MSVSAVAPTPFYHDPERLQIGLPQTSPDAKGAESPKDGDRRLSMFAAGDDEPSFWDLLDVINPLQHIPVVSNIYREMTGDQIGVGARLAGGTLFGGVIGLVASAVDCIIEEGTGQDTGGHMLALFRDEGGSAPTTAPATQFAQTGEPPAPQPAPRSAVASEAVSSSPAPAATQAAATAAAAPVITLPEAAGKPASQPMVFTLDGMQGVDAGPALAAPTIASPAIAAPAAAAATTAAMPVAQAVPAGGRQPMALTPAAGRTMPIPPRNAGLGVGVNAPPAPPLTVPVSSSGSRSNMPITGRSPVAAAMPIGNRAAVTQDRLEGHPMAPPTDASGQTAAGPDWFTAAWGQALDKYQRANQRNDKTGAGATSTLQ